MAYGPSCLRDRRIRDLVQNGWIVVPNENGIVDRAVPVADLLPSSRVFTLFTAVRRPMPQPQEAGHAFALVLNRARPVRPGNMNNDLLDRCGTVFFGNVVIDTVHFYGGSPNRNDEGEGSRGGGRVDNIKYVDERNQHFDRIPDWRNRDLILVPYPRAVELPDGFYIAHLIDLRSNQSWRVRYEMPSVRAAGGRKGGVDFENVLDRLREGLRAREAKLDVRW